MDLLERSSYYMKQVRRRNKYHISLTWNLKKSSTELTYKIETDSQTSKTNLWSSCCGSAEMNLTSFHEDAGLIPDLAQCVKHPVFP